MDVLRPVTSDGFISLEEDILLFRLCYSFGQIYIQPSAQKSVVENNCCVKCSVSRPLYCACQQSGGGGEPYVISHSVAEAAGGRGTLRKSNICSAVQHGYSWMITSGGVDQPTTGPVHLCLLSAVRHICTVCDVRQWKYYTSLALCFVTQKLNTITLSSQHQDNCLKKIIHFFVSFL